MNVFERFWKLCYLCNKHKESYGCTWVIYNYKSKKRRNTSFREFSNSSLFTLSPFVYFVSELLSLSSV